LGISCDIANRTHIMKSKRGKQMMTVKRKTDAVARVLDRLAELKINKPRAQKKSRPRSRKQKPLDKESGFAQVSTTSAPMAYGSTTKIQKPNFGRARTIIKHSEYVGDVFGSVAFTIAMTLNCNPGLPNAFPWLSQIANAYQKFCIKGIQYRFNTEAPSTITGSIFLSPEYNPQDPAPITKMETFQNENTAKTVPWRSVNCKIPTKYLRVYNDYFIRAGNLALNQDLKTYDPLVMYVCTQGQANANMCGEIWVDYEIELINPIGNMAYGSGSYYANAALTASVLSPGVSLGPLQITVGPVESGDPSFTMGPLVIGQKYAVVGAITGSAITGFYDSLQSIAPVSNFYNDINSAATQATFCTTFFATATTANTIVAVAATTVNIFDLFVVALPVGTTF
jgi:hypothetical protein